MAPSSHNMPRSSSQYPLATKHDTHIQTRMPQPYLSLSVDSSSTSTETRMCTTAMMNSSMCTCFRVSPVTTGAQPGRYPHSSYESCKCQPEWYLQSQPLHAPPPKYAAAAQPACAHLTQDTPAAMTQAHQKPSTGFYFRINSLFYSLIYVHIL
jgi:hypothetical protein